MSCCWLVSVCLESSQTARTLQEHVHCNYGFMGIMDAWFGTDATWKREVIKRKQALLRANGVLAPEAPASSSHNAQEASR